MCITDNNYDRTCKRTFIIDCETSACQAPAQPESYGSAYGGSDNGYSTQDPTALKANCRRTPEEKCYKFSKVPVINVNYTKTAYGFY